ncbi:zinc finger protein 62 homolog [Armigeres subalbatus]|uniref:zinc finger protein 62 homolog n=1 Tax=Armigeres subalbatus TaxID=124917 RepID=UPI002ED0C928
MTVFNLEHFPNVCRLCLKSDSEKLHSVKDNMEAVQMQIETFVAEVTYELSEEKLNQLPKFVCETCLKQLTDFAIYRNKVILTHRFMEALVDLKHSNSAPMTTLFGERKQELDVLFKDLSICTKPEPHIEDILQEYESYNFVNCEMPVKVKMEEQSEPDDMPDDDDSDFELSEKSENETRSGKKSLKISKIKIKSDDSSSDNEPLITKRRKISKTKSSPKASNNGPKKVGRPRIHPEGRHLQEPWSCDKCKFKTKYRVAVNRHKEVHERRENRTYPCSSCDLVFKTNEEMRTHGLSHLENRIVCEVCGASLKSGYALKIHMERHENKRKYSCDYCDYASFTKLTLRAHIKTHTAENKESCTLCGATFKKSGHLKRHMEGHNNERKHACEQCEARFNTRNALRNHYQRVHLGIRHNCDYCDKNFDQRIILRDHIERVHQIQCQFVCDICVITLDSQERLDAHKHRHDNPKPRECSVCLTIHPSPEALANHLCITYQDDYMCCNIDLRNHSKYNRHMLMKHGLKTNVRVKPIPGVLLGNLRGTRKRLELCRKCDIAFPTKALKVQHMIECNRSTAPVPAPQIEIPPAESDVPMHLNY